MEKAPSIRKIRPGAWTAELSHSSQQVKGYVWPIFDHNQRCNRDISQIPLCRSYSVEEHMWNMVLFYHFTLRVGRYKGHGRLLSGKQEGNNIVSPESEVRPKPRSSNLTLAETEWWDVPRIGDGYKLIISLSTNRLLYKVNIQLMLKHDTRHDIIHDKHMKPFVVYDSHSLPQRRTECQNSSAQMEAEGSVWVEDHRKTCLPFVTDAALLASSDCDFQVSLQQFITQCELGSAPPSLRPGFSDCPPGWEVCCFMYL